MAWDHWQIEKPDLGLTYVVYLDRSDSPNPQGFMIWGCLKTCESIALVAGDCQTGGENRMERGVFSEGIIPAATPTPHQSIS